MATFKRNDISVPESTPLPCVILLDGDEEADTRASTRGHPPTAPNRAVMQPEIYIVTSDDPALVGPALNRVRLMLLRSVLTDATLASLALDGDIRYEGCQTALALGRSITGEMGLVMSIARIHQP